MIRVVVIAMIMWNMALPVLADPIDYKVALKVAKTLTLKKSEFESWEDYVARLEVDCLNNPSALCQPVKIIERDRFIDYSPETETVQFFILSTSYRIPFQAHSPPGFPIYCTALNLLSSKNSKYTATNAFGVRVSVNKSVSELDGVAFVPSTPVPIGWGLEGSEMSSSATFGACYDHLKFKDSTQEGSQVIRVNKEDAKNERGKFLVELVGIPRSPYVMKLQLSKSPKIDDPFDTQNNATALLITPTHLRFLGAVTKKIYAEFVY